MNWTEFCIYVRTVVAYLCLEIHQCDWRF